MKALKPVLAILLPAILVWVLWQENVGETPVAVPAAQSVLSKVESQAREAPMNDLLIRRTPTAALLENFRPAVRTVSGRMEPNPYVAIPWETRLPGRQNHIDRGLYVMPVLQKVHP